MPIIFPVSGRAAGAEVGEAATGEAAPGRTGTGGEWCSAAGPGRPAPAAHADTSTPAAAAASIRQEPRGPDKPRGSFKALPDGSSSEPSCAARVLLPSSGNT